MVHDLVCFEWKDWSIAVLSGRQLEKHFIWAIGQLFLLKDRARKHSPSLDVFLNDFSIGIMYGATLHEWVLTIFFSGQTAKEEGQKT